MCGALCAYWQCVHIGNVKGVAYTPANDEHRLATSIAQIPTTAVPPPSILATMLTPLLHLSSWRTQEGVGVWAHNALLELPTTDGVPDARCRQVLLTLLLGFPDAIAHPASYPKVVKMLTLAISDFARVVRRQANASSFQLESYKWSEE